MTIESSWLFFRLGSQEFADKKLVRVASINAPA